MIYLDYAATTPMSEDSLHVYGEVNRNFYGNSSSLHDIGSSANIFLETCRSELAKLFNGKEQGVYFTSGGSESNILALQSLLLAHQHKGNHIITTNIEHSSISNFLKKLESEGFDVTYLPVDELGKVNPIEVENAITDKTILASIHYANSEMGVIQSIEEIGAILKKHNVLFHSDCVQTFGKIPINVVTANLDSISLSSHKIYGPKGVGAAYINPSVKWDPVFPGTSHENGFRPGTVNVPGIAAFISAASVMSVSMNENYQHFLHLRNQLKDGLTGVSDRIEWIEHASDQLPHIVGLRFSGIEGQYTMLEFNRYDVAISTGSACSVGKQAPSKTMLALGKTPEEAKQFVRISFGNTTTSSDITKVISICKTILQEV